MGRKKKLILGLLSDSHGQHERTARALRALQARGAEAFIHCGDVGGARVLDVLAGLRCWFVWGNSDCVDEPLCAYARRLGLSIPTEPPLTLDLEARRILVFHGHERVFEQTLAACRAGAPPACDYVLHGHTHETRDEQIGRVRVINPGALHRASPYTVARLDLLSGLSEFLEIAR